jgi:hypothetical protein
LELKEEITRAQRKLESTIRKEFPKKDVRNIGYPGGTNYDAKVFTNGHCWFWSDDHNGPDVPNPRHLNWFGLFNEGGDLQISVEINTAYKGRNDQVAGFFARNSDSGTIYLLHSGRVGGGTKGVSRAALLTWSNERLVEVMDSSGGVREGIVVMPVEGRAATRSAIRYIDTIARFKRAVRDGDTATPKFQRKQRRLADFYAEARGRRKGRRSSRIDYLSRHGDVVDALHEWRRSTPMPRGARVVKDVLIDMGVAVGDRLVETFEVKTATARAGIYSAIGQLLVHGTADDCRRVIVLPHKADIAEDLAEALQRLGIELLRFDLDAEKATIVDPR